VLNEAGLALEDMPVDILASNFLPQVMEINSPQPMDASCTSLLYDLKGW
jgi:hypothetical protein